MNLIYQTSVGEDKVYNEIEKISRMSFEKYAEIVDADYLLMKRRKLTIGNGCRNSLYFESLAPIFDEKLDVYDKILVADIDVVCNTEDNIFELSDASVYGVNEADTISNKKWGVEDYRCVGEWDYDEEVYQRYVDKFRKHGMPYKRSAINDPVGARYASKLFSLQSGVLVWTREARQKARLEFDNWNEFCYPVPKDPNDLSSSDQPFITGSLLKYGFDIECINFRWNDNPENYIKPQSEMDSIKFAHYAGSAAKKQMIQHARLGWFKMVEGYTCDTLPEFKLTNRVKVWPGGVRNDGIYKFLK